MQAIGGEITSQALNDNFSELDSKKLGKDELNYINALDYGADETGIQNSSASLQAAFNAAENKLLYIPKGTYLIDAPVKVKSNTKVISDGAVFKRKAAINVMLINDANGTTGGYDANENIWIEGITFDANKAEYASNVTSVAFGHCKRITVIRNKFINTYGWHALELNGVQHGYVAHNLFDGLDNGSELLQIDLMASASPFPWFGPYDNTVCKDIVIEQNEFKNSLHGIGSHTAISGYFHQAITIQHNLIKDLTGTGVKGYNWRQVYVRENRIDNCLFGVSMESMNNTNICSDLHVVRNRITNMVGSNARAIIFMGSSITGYGWCADSVISENYVETVGQHGIGADYGRNILIEKNIVKKCGQTGIYCYGTKNSVIRDNISTGNNTLNGGYYDMKIGGTGTASDTKANRVVGNEAGQISFNAIEMNIVAHNIYTGWERVNAVNSQFVDNFHGGTWFATE